MPENPATSTNEAAVLLGAVQKAQSSTRERLRARSPEFLLLVTAASFASVIGRRHNTADAAQMALIAVVLLVVAVFEIRHRHNLGGRIDRTAWILVGGVGAAALAFNIAFTGHTADAATGWCFAGGMALLAVAYRNWLLAVPALLVAIASLAQHGTASTVLSFIAGTLCFVAVAATGRRRTKTGRVRRLFTR